jgi:hypothetical protein
VSSNRWRHFVLSGLVGEVSPRPIAGTLQEIPALTENRAPDSGEEGRE